MKWYIKAIKHLVSAAFCMALPLCCLAKTGAEHLADINRMFGNEFKGNRNAEEVFNYISQGMDYGRINGPIPLEKPGSSFLKTIREEFPLFTGKHREFAHWGANGAIPKEVLADFGSVYPGQEGEFIKRWNKYILTRREATRQMLGLKREGARVAQSVFSLVNTRHILGDWTTADPSGLRNIDGLVEDIDKSLKTILGRRSEFAQKIAGECSEILKQKGLSNAERATQVAAKLDTIWPSIKPGLTGYGFNGAAQKVKWNTLTKEIEEQLAKNSARAATRAVSGSLNSAGRKLAEGGVLTALSREKSPRTLRNMSKFAKGSGRFLKWIPYAGVLIEAGVNGFEAWEYQRQYEEGSISRQERDRNWSGQAGSTVGGALGAGVGGKIGSELFRNDNGEAGAASIIAGLVFAAVGAIAGSMAGESAATHGYDAIMTTPYEQACKLATEGDRDAMRFAGEYLWNGKYTAVDKDAAFSWWQLKCEKDLAEGKIDRTTLLRVGDCCASGIGTEKNVNEAMYYWELSQTVPGNLRMAKCRLEGADVAQSYNQTVVLLNSCADVGCDEARSMLADLHREAMEGWLVNDPECSYMLGVFYGNGCKSLSIEKDTDKAAQLFEDSAEVGYPAAINHVGLLYEYGGFAQTNLTLAARHYQLAAQNGNAYGLRNYGICLLKGEGVQKDLRKGRDCLLEAERMGAIPYRGCDELLRKFGGAEYVELIKRDVESAATDFLRSLLHGDWFEIYCKLPSELQRNIDSFVIALGRSVPDKDWEEIEKLLPEIAQMFRSASLKTLREDSKTDAEHKELDRALVEKCYAVLCALKKAAVQAHDVKSILQARPSSSSMSCKLPPLMDSIMVSEDWNKITIQGGFYDGDCFVYLDGAWYPEFLIEGLKQLPSVTKEMKTYGESMVILLRALKDIGFDKPGDTPPITVSFRTGFLSDNVLQVYNKSDKRIQIHIHVSYPPTSEQKDMEFSIAPETTEEYGALEMASWQFSPGGCGWITAQGYSGKVNFEILNGNQYRTW